MSFWVSIENAPKEAKYWTPIFYYRDPETGAYTPYYPDEYLDIPQSWLCPLSAGTGIMVDFRCLTYDDDYETIGTRDLSNIVVRDGEEFVYEWAGGGISGWLVALPLGMAALLGIAVVAGKKRGGARVLTND